MAETGAQTGSRTEQMREVILRGNEFEAEAIARQFGLSRASVNLCMRHLKMLGYEVERLDVGWWRLTNPQHTPSDEQWEYLRAFRNKPVSETPPPPHLRKRAAKASVPATVPLPMPEPESVPAPRPAAASVGFGMMSGTAAGIVGVPGFERAEPVNYRGMQAPNLGGLVSVFAQVIQDDGTLRLGLQTGDRRWVVDVIAEIAR